MDHPNRNEQNKSMHLHDLVIFSFYVLFSILVTWPVSFRISRNAIGIPNGDVWDHLWSMDWARLAVMDNAYQFFHRMDAYFPSGLYLYPLNLFNELLSIPFQLMFGLVAAFNLVVLIQLVFAAWATYKLAMYFTPSPGSAMIAGVVFAFTPTLMVTITNGTYEMANTGWLPLFVLLIFKAVEKNASKKLVVLSALVMSIGALAFWLNMVFELIFAGFFIGYVSLSFSKDERKKALLKICLIILLALLLVLPYALFIQNSLNHDDAQDLKAHFFNRTLERPTVSADLKGIFLPMQEKESGFYHPAGIGIVVFIIALIGLVKGKIARSLRIFFFVAAFLFLLLSLGPNLGIGSLRPYEWAMKSLPFFGYLEFPYRFVIMASLCLAILASAGLERLFRNMAPLIRNSFCVVIAVVVFAEYCFAMSWPLPNIKTEIPAIYSELGKDDIPGGVIELPICFDTKGKYFFHQLSHRREIPVGINSVAPKSILNIVAPKGTKKEKCSHLTVVNDETANRLKNAGFRYVILHKLNEQNVTLLEADPRMNQSILFKNNEMIVLDMALMPDEAN